MSSTDTKTKGSSLFHLINENYSPSLFYFYLIAFILNFLSLITISLYSISNPDNTGTLIFSSLPLLVTAVFFGILSYNEYRGRFDFIKITPSSVKFQHSPKFFYTGWLSKKKEIKFSNIESIRVIQIKTGLDILDEKIKQSQLNPEALINKRLLIEINLKTGQSFRIGERLSPAGIIQVAILIETRAQLGNLYTKFKEKYPIIGETISKLKNIFKKKDL
jgi:hypothetical protein